MELQGGELSKNRGARGVPFMDYCPLDKDNIGEKCRLPFVYTSLAHPEFITSI